MYQGFKSTLKLDCFSNIPQPERICSIADNDICINYINKNVREHGGSVGLDGYALNCHLGQVMLFGGILVM